MGWGGVRKKHTPSVPLYKHLKLSNAKIAGMEKDACAFAFVSTQVLEETGEHGVVDGDWRSKRMWGSLESRNAYIYAQSLNAWNAFIKGLRE